MPIGLGFVGIGNMGLPMAFRLMQQGHPMTVFDIRDDAMRPLILRGARAASSPANLASDVETVLVCLPSPDVVQEVVLGTNGLINGSKTRVFVDLSTTGPEVADGLADRLEEKGIATLNAPVSGGPPGAEKGTLAVMVSGPEPVFEQIQPVLQVIGKNVYYLGAKPGLAQMMKLINNLLSATVLAASCEAFVLGVKAGLDPEMMLQGS